MTAADSSEWAPKLALIGATFLWGANLSISKEALVVLSPLQLMSFRWFPALIIIGVLAIRFEKLQLPNKSSEWIRVGLSSLFGAAGYSYFLYHALTLLNPNQVAVLGALNPIMIIVCSALVYRSRASIRMIIGMIIAVIGVVVMFAGNSLLESRAELPQTLFGISLMLIALLSWTIFTMVGGKSTTPPLTSTTIQAAATIVASSAVLFAVGEFYLPEMNATQWLSFSYVAVAATSIAFVLWLVGVKHLGAIKSGPFLNLVPVFAIMVSTVTGYPLSWAEVLGALLTVVGTIISTTRAKARIVEPSRGQ